MKPQRILTAFALAAVTGAALSTAAFADRGMMGGMMGGNDMGMGMEMGHGPDFDFAAVDADKDGKVTEAELTAWRAAQATKIDTDKDGKLSAAELSASRLAEMTVRITQMTQEMVTNLDTDGDNLLTAAELAARPMPAMLFDRADADQDGAITQAELDAMQAQGPMGGDRGHGKGRGFGWHLFGRD